MFCAQTYRGPEKFWSWGCRACGQVDFCMYGIGYGRGVKKVLRFGVVERRGLPHEKIFNLEKFRSIT